MKLEINSFLLQKMIFSTLLAIIYSGAQHGQGHNNAVRVPEFVKELCGQQLNEISYGLRHMLSLTEDSLFSGASNIYGQLGSRQK